MATNVKTHSKKVTHLDLSAQRIEKMQSWEPVGLLKYLTRTLEILFGMKNEGLGSLGFYDKVGHFIVSTWGNLSGGNQWRLYVAFSEIHFPGPALLNRLSREWNWKSAYRAYIDEKLRDSLREAYNDVLDEMRIGICREILRQDLKERLSVSRFPATIAFIRENFSREDAISLIRSGKVISQKTEAKKVYLGNGNGRKNGQSGSRSIADQLKGLIEEGQITQASGFVASPNGTVYHPIGSTGALKLADSVFFPTAEAAERAGYAPSAEVVERELMAA